MTARPEQLELAPEPPTGPAVEVPTKAQGTYRAYLAWLETEDGRYVREFCLQTCERLIREGVKRIGVKQLVEAARAQRPGTKANNTFTAWLADDLVERAPWLLDLVERRRRRKSKR